MTYLDELTDLQFLQSILTVLRRIEARVGIPEIPAPQVSVTAAPPDFTDVVNAVTGLRPGPTAEEIARALAGVLVPMSGPPAGVDALGEVARALEKLDFHLQGMGTQAYGGGTAVIDKNSVVQAGLATEATLSTMSDRVAPVYATRTDTFTGVGNGVVVDRSTSPLTAYGLQVKGTGAAATAWTVELQGSLDNANWSSIITHDTTSGDGLVKWSGALLAPALYLRSRAAALTLGAASNVVVTFLGSG